MPNEYIHYIKRNIVLRYPKNILDPWFSEIQCNDEGFKKPSYHVTRSRNWPVDEIKAGDVIWLVSQLTSPWGRLPPSLDAKIEVEDIEVCTRKNQMKTKFYASDNSYWLPLANGFDVLSKLQIVSKTGSVSTPFRAKEDNLGQAFQSIKKIYYPEPIRALAQRLERSPFDFVSYRIKDGTKCAFLFLNVQLKGDGVFFWDRWSLPRRLAERRELVADSVLDDTLHKKISESKIVYGIESPCYNEDGSYSSIERELATSLNKYKSLECS